MPPETRRRVVFEDPDLPHQIVITVNTSANGRIAVSCNCLRFAGARSRRNGTKHKPLETRSRWESGEAIAVWRKHMTEIGEPAA